jgi:ribosomal protein L21
MAGNNDSGVVNRNSRDIANNTNRPVQNYLIIGKKNNNAKIGKPSLDKPRVSIESKKMGKIKKLYGKSKSPSEMSQKFMNPSTNFIN